MKKLPLVLFIMFTLSCFNSCKTKQLIPEASKQPETVFIQVTDRAQISYCALKFTVFFSDGTVQQSVTDVEGKVIIKPSPEIIILKIVYDFTNYKRPEGKLLAKEDFKFAKKVKTKPNSLIQEFQINLTATAGAKTILILDTF